MYKSLCGKMLWFFPGRRRVPCPVPEMISPWMATRPAPSTAFHTGWFQLKCHFQTVLLIYFELKGPPDHTSLTLPFPHCTSLRPILFICILSVPALFSTVPPGSSVCLEHRSCSVSIDCTNKRMMKSECLFPISTPGIRHLYNLCLPNMRETSL